MRSGGTTEGDQSPTWRWGASRHRYSMTTFLLVAASDDCLSFLISRPRSGGSRSQRPGRRGESKLRDYRMTKSRDFLVLSCPKPGPLPRGTRLLRSSGSSPIRSHRHSIRTRPELAGQGSNYCDPTAPPGTVERSSITWSIPCRQLLVAQGVRAESSSLNQLERASNTVKLNHGR
jgi:hypothetical protein